MRATLLAACVAAALGKRAGNTLMPRAEDDRTASLVQFTDPPAAEATKAAASTGLRAATTKAADTELFDAEDCTRVMSPGGVCACCNTWTLAQVSSLFMHGHPDNVLSSVGLTVHGFDGTLQGGGGAPFSLMTGAAYTNSGMLPWLPCDSGWCRNTSRWLSTSVINAAHHPGFSDGGIILKPGATQVLCSHYRDFESLHDGCATDVNKHDGTFHDQPFPPDDLRGMLQASLTYQQAYNEVLVDGKVRGSLTLTLTMALRLALTLVPESEPEPTPYTLHPTPPRLPPLSRCTRTTCRTRWRPSTTAYSAATRAGRACTPRRCTSPSSTFTTGPRTRCLSCSSISRRQIPPTS